MSVAGFQDRPKRQTGMGGFSGGSGYWENRGQRNWWAEPTLPGSFACVVIASFPRGRTPVSSAAIPGRWGTTPQIGACQVPDLTGPPEANRVGLSWGDRTDKRGKRARAVSLVPLAIGKTGSTKLAGQAHPTWLTLYILVTSNISSMAILGRMEGRERASIVLPLPGGPFMIAMWPRDDR